MTGMQEKLRVPPDFDGPVQSRKCTDILFTLAIILLWVAMTGVGISSVQEVRASHNRHGLCIAEQPHLRQQPA